MIPALQVLNHLQCIQKPWCQTLQMHLTLSVTRVDNDKTDTQMFQLFFKQQLKGKFSKKRYLAQKPYPTSCMNSARELSMMVFANSPESGRILSMGMSRFSGYSSGASTTGQRSWGKSETQAAPMENY